MGELAQQLSCKNKADRSKIVLTTKKSKGDAASELQLAALRLMVLTIGSIPSLHFLGFLAAMPGFGRQLVDFRFSFGLTASFTYCLAISIFLAGYLPKLLLGIFIFAVDATIDTKYYRRGYRRIYVPFTGFGSRARQIKGMQALNEHLALSAKFDRRKARLSNLKSKQMNSRFPVSFFAKNQLVISAVLVLLLFSILYVGWLRSIFFFALLLIFLVGLLIFHLYGEGYIFRLEREWWTHQDSSQGEAGTFFDPEMLPTLFAVVAVCSFSLGYLRYGYIVSSREHQTTSSNLQITTIGINGDGVIAIDKSDEKLVFIPFSTIDALHAE